MGGAISVQLQGSAQLACFAFIPQLLVGNCRPVRTTVIGDLPGNECRQPDKKEVKDEIDSNTLAKVGLIRATLEPFANVEIERFRA